MKIMTKGSLALLALLTVGTFTATSVEAEEVQKPLHTDSISVDLAGIQPLAKQTVELAIIPPLGSEKDAPKLEKAEKIKTTIKEGDTLNKLAEKFNVSVDALQYNNKIAKSHIITVSDELIIGGTEFEKDVPESFYKEQRVLAEAEKKAADLKIKEAKQAEEAKIKKQAEEETARKDKQAEQAAEEAKVVEQQATQTSTQTTQQETTQAASVQTKEVAQTNTSNGYQVTVEATAYSRNQPSLSNFTANGTDLRSNPNVIAVDPSQIPIGSQVYVPGYGTFTAADTGGDIHNGRIDIHMESLSAAQSFGRRSITVTVLN